MIRHAQLSREARKRKLRRLGTADNHKQRRHWGKIYMNAGFKQELLKVDPDGRKHYYYVRNLSLPHGHIWEEDEVEVLPSAEEYVKHLVERFNIPHLELGAVVVDEETRG